MEDALGRSESGLQLSISGNKATLGSNPWSAGTALSLTKALGNQFQAISKGCLNTCPQVTVMGSHVLIKK